MAKPDGASMPEDPEWLLLRQLRESGDALESVSPLFDAASGASRLREAARAHGFLQPGGIPEDDLAVTGTELEGEAPPFDVEVGAARLQEEARARGLLPGGALEDFVEAGFRIGERDHGTPRWTEVVSSGGLALKERYRLLSRLGTGSYGSVWRAEDRVLGRTVALKELAHLSGDHLPERRAIAMREARALASVSHPAIASVYGVFLADGDPWIAMEYVKGRSLAEIMLERNVPLDEPEIARIGLPVVRGLLAIHDAGIVHGDVKPANIMVTGNDQVFLVDFGVAKIAEKIASTGKSTVVGTPEFLAPEQISGNSVRGEADLWSLGVTFFWALEGYSPFRRHGDGLEAIMLAVTSAELPRMTRPGQLADIVSRLLQKQPSDRPGADEVADVLQSILDELPAPQAHPGAPALGGSAPADTESRDVSETLRNADIDATLTRLLAMSEHDAAKALTGYPPRLVGELIEAITAARHQAAVSIVRILASSTVDRALSYLSPSTAASILAAMPTDEAARILSRADVRTAAEVITELPSRISAQLISMMPSKGVTRMLEYVTPATLTAVDEDNGGNEIAVYHASVSLVATTAQGITSIYRQNRTITKGQLELLRIEAERSVALAQSRALGDIARANLHELIETARLIESLDVFSAALPYSMDQLEQLSRSLRRIVDDF